VSWPERAAELRAELEEHNRRYYVLDDPTIGDDAYDALLDELRRIEAEHPELVTPDSPTQRVGGGVIGAVVKLAKVTHLQRMLSLANARSEEELRAWGARTSRARGSRIRTSPTSASRRSTAWRCRWSTATASSSAAPPAATARSARTSPTTCARSRRSRSGSRTRRR
jgi:hypothetical protein